VGLAYTISWRDQGLCLQALDAALRLSAYQSDPQLQARTRISSRVWRIWVRGWSEDDVRACEEALADLRAGRDPLTAAWGFIEYSMICMISTRYREAHDTIKRNYHLLFDSIENRSEFNIARAVWMVHLGVPWTLLFIGDLGNSLNEFDRGIAVFVKNGNEYGARTLQLYRAWLLLHAMDHAGVADICRKIASEPDDEHGCIEARPTVLLPAERRLCILLSGLAEAGLGNTAVALEQLREAERHMDEQPVIFDWYWRLPLEWGLVNLTIEAGRQAEAYTRADRLVNLTHQTGERTWRALAWETKARAALHYGDVAEAEESIARALATTRESETPLADWRVHETAAAAYSASGNSELAGLHARLSAAGKKRLAESLPDGHYLRPAFERSL
jgi:tetratricopeptide (TPR) repeat protein